MHDIGGLGGSGLYYLRNLVPPGQIGFRVEFRTGTMYIVHNTGDAIDKNNRALNVNKMCTFKGSVSRDFRPPFFFMIRTHLGPC